MRKIKEERENLAVGSRHYSGSKTRFNSLFLRMRHDLWCSLGQGEAFSLLELVLVTVLIGIISVMIVPKAVNLIDNMRLRAAADNLKDDLRYIHDYAITRHDTTWLVVNTADNSYGIYRGPSSANRVLILDPSTNEQALVDFDDQYRGVQITSVDFAGNSEFSYDLWGTPSSGGMIILNGIKTIVVVSETGYIYETE